MREDEQVGGKEMQASSRNPDEINLEEEDASDASAAAGASPGTGGASAVAGVAGIVQKRVPDAVFGGVQRGLGASDVQPFDDADEEPDADVEPNREGDEAPEAHPGLGHRGRDSSETTVPKKRPRMKLRCRGRKLAGKQRHDVSYD